MGQPEPAADDPAVPEELLDLAGMRVRADVEVLGPAPEHQVSNAAPNQIGDVFMLLQAMEDAQRVRVDVPARDRCSHAGRQAVPARTLIIGPRKS